MKKNLLKLSKNKIIVSISQKDRDAIFRKEFVTSTGRQLFLVKENEAKFTHDEFYSQTVNIGTVEQVSPDVTNFKIGDVVVMENLADADPNNILETFEGGKKVLLTANTAYYDHSRYDPPEGLSRTGKFFYKKGDIKFDERSFIICIVRNGEFITVGKNIIARHENDNPDPLGTGIKLRQDINTPQPRRLAVRYVLVAPEGSHYKHGDVVLTLDNWVATFDIGNKLFNWFQTDDVMLHKMVAN